jgi:formate-dependent nitrite reductase membrane component NrfD
VKHIEWEFLIVNYLFLGGLSAGLYFLAALTTLLQKEGEVKFGNIARRGAILAPWPVMIGTALLIFDLGKWYRFYKLMLHFRWTSPMSIGTWLLMLFNVLSILFLWSWLSAKERDGLFSRLPKPLAFLVRFNYDLAGRRRGLALAGLPLSVGVGIYTGVLLGAVQSRPFWNTNLVAQLFLLSALSSGCAALMLTFLSGKEKTREDVHFLYILDVVFLTLEFFIVLPYVIHGQLSVQPVQDALQLILGGPFTVIFWIAFVGMGLLLPLLVELYEIVPALVGRSPFHFDAMMMSVTAVLVLVGGFLLRYIFIYAGQMSTFN